jgi:hypothetical protein
MQQTMVALQEKKLGRELAIQEARNSTLITIALVIILNALRSGGNTHTHFTHTHLSLFLKFGFAHILVTCSSDLQGLRVQVWGFSII